jgi:imidazole glycerol-phosphate synthase subunit HisH
VAIGRSSFRTVIVDYGTGNLTSVKRALDRIRAPVVISSRPDDIKNADKIILPGVGHFDRAMHTLKDLGLVDALNEAVLAKGKPILGICLGMEIMAKTSEEGNLPGLGWFDAELIRFDITDHARFKVPHMGWNQIRVTKPSVLFAEVCEEAEFYFAHSYHLKLNDRLDLLNETDYGIRFPSAIERENIFGVQYHPEKSHDAGARLLKNFVEM